VSTHDAEALQSTDYVQETSTTNDIAILAPYEVSFRCFSSELAAVLSGYASSPHGLIVRAINIEPAVAAGSSLTGADLGGYSPYAAATGGPSEGPQPTRAQPRQPAGGGFNPYQATQPGGGYNPYATAAAPTPVRTAPGRGGLPTLLDEKQIKVTMLVQVVKLRSRK
jgi:hypothetical protein